MTETGPVPPGVDPTRPTTARIYDYFLGGTNNYPVDREVAERLKAATPDAVDALLSNRGFHGRAAAWMARHGIDQFIDLGSGLPTQNNTHESVRRVIPGARVVYVDIDPMVAAHANSLLSGDGSTALIMADMREPEAVLGNPDVRRLIDFSRPVGLIATDVLHFFPDAADPWALMARYMAALPAGSYLALTHFTHDKMPLRSHNDVMDALEKAQVALYLRSREDVERFFAGLQLVPPYDGAERGVTYAGLWGAEEIEAADTDGSRSVYCGVARRPEGFTAGRSTAVVAADLREPDVVLSHPDVRRLIDVGEPAGVLATDVMHFIPDGQDP
jgi:S-adenosyl methyltransferase